MSDEAEVEVRCQECGAVYPGRRQEARRDRWEPFSNRTQRLLDQGPMVCPDCVLSIIRGVQDALLDRVRSEGRR